MDSLIPPHTRVIAEMAWAHNGSRDVALRLVRGAHEAGADAIGIHVTNLAEYMVPHYRCVDGVTTSDRSVGEIYEYLERLNLTQDDWVAVFGEARRVGLDVCVMCNDASSLAFVEAFDPEIYALAAACFSEYAFVRAIGRAKKPVILRVGGATIDEMERSITLLREEGAGEITLLHGIQLYPTSTDVLNISALPTLKTMFPGCHVGLADHIDGDLDEALVLPLLSLPYGVAAIEKHITVDRALKHEDFEAALGVPQFERFVRYIRAAERALGSGRIGPLSEGDLKYRRVSRKKTVARVPIRRGTMIAAPLVTFKRSDTGVDPGEAELLTGREAIRDIAADEGLDFTNCV